MISHPANGSDEIPSGEEQAYDDEDFDEDEDEEDGEDDGDIDGGSGSPQLDVDTSFTTPPSPGLRDISSLATWTLSSSKPGCGLSALRHPSPSRFWQSDGPQPHTLTLHFFKVVGIVRMRIYLDYELDESYTPTVMKFAAGMREGGLVEFGKWEAPGEGEAWTDPATGEVRAGIESVRGWVEIPLQGVGGREIHHHDSAGGRGLNGHYTSPRSRLGRKKPTEAKRQAIKRRKRAQFMRDVGGVDPDHLPPGYDVDEEMPAVEDFSSEEEPTEEEKLAMEARMNGDAGDVLRAMVVQIRVCENHQNGKDTHVRGFQVWARDERAGAEAAAAAAADEGSKQNAAGVGGKGGGGKGVEVGGLGRGGKGIGGRFRRVVRIEDVPDEEGLDQGEGRTKAQKEGGVGAGGGGKRVIMGIEEAEWMGEPEIR